MQSISAQSDGPACNVGSAAMTDDATKPGGPVSTVGPAVMADDVDVAPVTHDQRPKRSTEFLFDQAEDTSVLDLSMQDDEFDRVISFLLVLQMH